jgi:DNA-binding IclR family transcriptional regulator
VLDAGGRLVAVVSVSGPASRLGRSAGRRYAPGVLGAAARIASALQAGSMPEAG